MSVVSALARLDLDAWNEAATLSRLPRAAATAKLSGLLRRFTEIPRLGQDPNGVAAGLIALLPNSSVPRLPAMAAPGRVPAGPAAIGFGVLVASALFLGLQFYSMMHAAPASAPSHLHTPALPAAPPP